MIRAVLLCLCLCACGDRDAAVVTISPTLPCAERVRCHIYDWQIGVRQAAKLGGTHINCHCSKE